jgi:hypothetical protein
MGTIAEAPRVGAALASIRGAVSWRPTDEIEEG